MRQLSRTKHREVYYARIERVFKNARTLTSRHNGIFGDASLVMFADHRIERCACQVHTSAPLFEPPWGVSADNNVGIGVWNLRL